MFLVTLKNIAAAFAACDRVVHGGYGAEDSTTHADAFQAANFFDNTIAGINLGNASWGNTSGHKGWAIFALQSATVNYDVAMQGGNTEARGNVAIANVSGIDARHV